MNRRIALNVTFLIVSFIGFSALLYVVFGLIEYATDKTENGISGDDYSYSDYSGEQIFYESEWYVPKESVESILIMGIDKKTGESEERENSEQADFLALLVMDEALKTYEILYINRDTMTDIAQTDALGEEYGKIKAQVAIAHAYGDNEKIRCRNTINAVEGLLYGIDIDHYISMTMDAVPILNDSIGGVTLELMDDFTELDESFVEGARVTLYGDHALLYVQERGALEDSSNLHRMERQQQYISAVLEKLGGISSQEVSDAVLQVNDYVTSDCTVNQLSKIFEQLTGYTYEGSVSLEGEARRGAQFMEFHADEQAMQALVVEMFYELRD